MFNKEVEPLYLYFELYLESIYRLPQNALFYKNTYHINYEVIHIFKQISLTEQNLCKYRLCNEVICIKKRK